MEKCDVFSDFKYGFKSSRSTADYLTVASDRINRTFNRSGTGAVALDISKAFNRVWHASLLHKLKSYGISVQILGLLSCFLSNRWFWVGRLHENIQLMLVPIDTGRRLNVHKVHVFWTSYVRSMYVLCLRGSSSKLHSWSYTFPSIH